MEQPEFLRFGAKKVQEIESNLSGTQLDAFRRLQQNEFNQLNQGFQRHLSGEIRRYDDETTSALVKNETDFRDCEF